MGVQGCCVLFHSISIRQNYILELRLDGFHRLPDLVEEDATSGPGGNVTDCVSLQQAQRGRVQGKVQVVG